MTRQEYDQNKRECFVKFCKDNGIDQEVNISIFDAFDQIFDRAYALGREKETITQEEIEKVAKEYVLTRQQARHNAKREEDATLRDFDKTIKAWDAFDMEQAYEDGANFALAREYAEEYTKKKYPNVTGHVRERIVEGRLEHMEDFIPWLLRRYCLVEKEAVRKEYESVKDTPDECNYEEMGATWDESPYLSRFYYEGYKCGQKDAIESLFPDLTWESEPQEVEITIKRKKR